MSFFRSKRAAQTQTGSNAAGVETRVNQALSVLRRLENLRAQLELKEADLIKGIKAASDSRDIRSIHKSSAALAANTKAQRVLDMIRGDPPVTAQRFVFSSLMLIQSFRYTTKTKDEDMHFIMGVDFEGVLIGTQFATFALASQSPTYVCGDLPSTARIQFEAFEADHKIIAHIHSHPGHGCEANHHSSTDDGTQEVFGVGRRIVGGVWSREAYIRFFTHRMPFTIQVIGNYMSKVEGEDHVWKIEKAGLDVPAYFWRGRPAKGD